MGGPDSIYYLPEYKRLIACPHPHAAPGKSRLCCTCSHGSILDHRKLPPKSFLRYSHHAISYVRASEKFKESSHKKLKASENSIENGFNVSTKLPRLPHWQPKTFYFLEDYHECPIMSRPVCKPAMQPFHHHPLKILTNFSYDHPAPILSIFNLPVNHPGLSGPLLRYGPFSHLPGPGVNAHSLEYLPRPQPVFLTPRYFPTACTTLHSPPP